VPLLRLGAGELERVHRALGQHRTELEGEVGGRPELLHGAAQRLRHALAAEARIAAELLPAADHELAVRLLEALRGRHALGRPVRPLAIAGPVERIEHRLGEARRLLENRCADLVAVVGEGGTGGELSDAEELLEHETQFLERRAVHDSSPASAVRADGRPGGGLV